MQRRWLGPVAFAILAAVGCKSGTTTTQGGGTPQPTPTPVATVGPCDTTPGGQDGPNGAPFVCIDFQTFDQAQYQPSPNPIQANHSVVVQFWFYNTQGADPQMELQFTADTPIHNLQCNGGHCMVQVLPNVPPGSHISKKYSIIDSVSGRHKDPDILIEP